MVWSLNNMGRENSEKIQAWEGRGTQCESLVDGEEGDRGIRV